jgi:hypothetical protein
MRKKVTRRRRWALSLSAAAVGLAAAVMMAVGVGGRVPQVAAATLPSNCAQYGPAVVCTYTSGANAFVVPDGVTTVNVVAVGGKGGGSEANRYGSGAPGGFGARVTGDLAVTAGSTLYAVVGGNGIDGTFSGSCCAGGANGGGDGQVSGGGGGASDVRTSPDDLSTRLIVAGGGGGGGAPGTDNHFADDHGGAGGDAGVAGSQGFYDNTNADFVFPGEGGGAASSTSGGAGGAGGEQTDAEEFPGCTGDAGGLGQGGTGGFEAAGVCNVGGGGGGGGLYGGGGGGGGLQEQFVFSSSVVEIFAADGGGGGGSSLVPHGGSLSADSTGVPGVLISYTVPDTTAPTTTITLDPAAPNGLAGWYNSPVQVSVTATDPDDAVSQTRCFLDPASAPASFSDLPDQPCSLTQVSTDGAHTIYAASTDSNGNQETPVALSFMIDQTPPVLAPTITSSVITLGETGVSASPNATDATSGVGSASCGAIDTSTAGDHTVACTATDNAGNTASATIHYTVTYQILGFFSPVPSSKWKLGQTVPVKVALGGINGTRLPDAEAASLASACHVQFAVSGAQVSAPQCMKYDSVNHQFVFTWKIGDTGTGPATISVTVSYNGTATTTTMSDAITITA